MFEPKGLACHGYIHRIVVRIAYGRIVDVRATEADNSECLFHPTGVSHQRFVERDERNQIR